MKTIVNTIKDQLAEKAPDVLSQLKGPASENNLQNIELKIGRSLPSSYKVFIKMHDGDPAEYGFFGGGHRLLPSGEILNIYDPTIGVKEFSLRDFKYMKLQISEGHQCIEGPVYPYIEHPGWLPIMDTDVRVYRYLDFNPAPGGKVGQVIETDWESEYWSVLAPSFEELLANYGAILKKSAYAREFHYGLSACRPVGVPQAEIPSWLLEITAHDPTEYSERDEREEWFEDFAADLSDIDTLGYPHAKKIVGLQTYKRSKLDREYFEIRWEENNKDYIAFIHHRVYDEIPSQIRPFRQKGIDVEMDVVIEKRNNEGDPKSNPSWDNGAWLEIVKVAFNGEAKKSS